MDSPSALGPWSYEVADTKLAIETRAGTILQLGLYCDLLTTAQSACPEYFYVVTPDADQPVNTYRINGYSAYFRLLRSRLEAFLEGDDDALAADNYPEPVDHCDVCAWASVCSTKRRHDDHLSLVAGITRIQRTELQTRDINTVVELAKTPLPLTLKPRRGALLSYVRIREQARVQVEARSSNEPVFELLQPIEAEKGLCRLPEPSLGDLFLDLEGDPFAGEAGREYLFGMVSLNDHRQPIYSARWALTVADEGNAFDELVSLIMDTWAAHPGMHVYHYAPYEPTALKRLMGRFARRDKEIDALLRRSSA